MSRRCDVHKLKRVRKEGKQDIYKCQLCPAYYTESIVVGHQTTCWKCGRSFIMNVNSMLHKPMCGCQLGSKSKVSTTVKDAKQTVIDALLSKVGG